MKRETLDYLDGRKKLTPLEYDIMKFIWKHPEGIQSGEIYKYFSQSRSTLGTFLFKISEKGYLTNKQVGRHHIYTALVSELEYERALLKQQLKNATGRGSFECLVAAFYGKDKLNERQLEKMHDLIEEFENTIDDE